LSLASQLVRSWATGSTRVEGEEREVFRGRKEEGMQGKEWEVRKKGCNRLKEIKSEKI
jgi:hypothetical protein